MQQINKEGMAEGVQQSAFLILFLSEGVLCRPYVQFELEVARQELFCMGALGGEDLRQKLNLETYISSIRR